MRDSGDAFRKDFPVHARRLVRIAGVGGRATGFPRTREEACAVAHRASERGQISPHTRGGLDEEAEMRGTVFNGVPAHARTPDCTLPLTEGIILQMLGLNEVQKTGIAIRETIRIIDNHTPQDPVRLADYNYAKMAPLFALSHWGIEIGLKALILQETQVHYRIHALRKLFRQLKGKAPKQAKYLEDTFIEIVNFYTIDKSKWKSFKTLDTYLGEYGKKERYQTFRYWPLENQALFHTHLFVHRELLKVLEDRCVDGRKHSISRRVRSIIRNGFSKGIGKHLNKENRCEPCWKNTSGPHKPQIQGFNDSSSTLFHAIRDDYSRRFNINQVECMDEITRWAVQYLEKHDDPAVRYCVIRRNDLPQGSVSLPSDVELDVEWSEPDILGIVKIKNGVKLGSILYGIDSRWRAQVDMYSLKFRFAKTKDDAMNWLVNKCTEVVQISVNGGPHIPKRVMFTQSQDWSPSWDDTHPRYKMVFADEAHGLSEGQRIDVRSDRFPSVLHDGTIVKVSGREVVCEDISYTLKYV